MLFGAGTTLISWGSYALFISLCLSVTISNALSWVCAVLFAFVTNKLFVFSSRSWRLATLLREAGEFFTTRAATGVLTLLGVPILMRLGLDQSLFGIEGMLAKIVMSVLEIVINYVVSKLIIFKKK